MILILKIEVSTQLHNSHCLLYTSDAADDMQCVDLGGRRIIKKGLDVWVGGEVLVRVTDIRA